MAVTTVINGCRTTKIYCRPRCPPGRRTKPENRVYFGSRNEARTRGYRACKVCKPDHTFKVRETFFLSHYNSPLGLYVLASSEKGIVCIKTETQAPRYMALWENKGIDVQIDAERHLALGRQLDAYFERKLHRFKVLLDIRGTPFQREVWDLLSGIPFGKTRTYGDIAKALGRPNASRAVGRAVGTNPVAIVVPCHRVIGSDGSLTGYGGGLERKEALLELEAFEDS